MGDLQAPPGGWQANLSCSGSGSGTCDWSVEVKVLSYQILNPLKAGFKKRDVKVVLYLAAGAPHDYLEQL